MTIYIFNQILNLYLIGLKIIIFHCTLENAVLCYLQENALPAIIHLHSKEIL